MPSDLLPVTLLLEILGEPPARLWIELPDVGCLAGRVVKRFLQRVVQRLLGGGGVRLVEDLLQRLLVDAEVIEGLAKPVEPVGAGVVRPVLRWRVEPLRQLP